MQCESQTLELKAAHEGCPGKLYDTLSAFSNQDTGGNSYEAFRKKYQDDIRVNERADMTAIEIPKMEHYVDTIKDRIEIRNPGGLYRRMSLDTLGKTQPDTRNPVLARAMETLGLTENRYSGIPTMQRELREAGLREAVFSDSRNEFVVTFYNEEAKPAQIEENESRSLLEFCSEPRSRKEIADFLGISTIYYVTQNYINPLLETGQLKMTKPETPKSKNQKFYS